jgi:opacity protein-like surface antigen
MRTGCVGGTACAVLLMCSTALAAGGPTGFEVGVRVGYAWPFGQVAKSGNNGNSDLDTLVSGSAPIAFDIGYRVLPQVSVGAFVQYGVGLVSGGTMATAVCDQNSVRCTASDQIFGLEAQYHFVPGGKVDPYVGLGLGYEVFTFDISQGNQFVPLTLRGWQLFDLQAGLDYKPASNLGIGPFVTFSLGQYGDCSLGDAGGCSIRQQAPHEWLTLGARVVFDAEP